MAIKGFSIVLLGICLFGFSLPVLALPTIHQDPHWIRRAPVHKPEWERPAPKIRWDHRIERWKHYSQARRQQIMDRARRFHKLPPAQQRKLWQEYQQSRKALRP